MTTEITPNLTNQYVQKILEKEYDQLDISSSDVGQLLESKETVVYIISKIQFTKTGKLTTLSKNKFLEVENYLIKNSEKHRLKIIILTDVKAYKTFRTKFISKGIKNETFKGKIHFTIPNTDVNVRLVEFPVFKNTFASKKFKKNDTLTFSQIFSVVKLGFLKIKDLPTKNGKLLHLDNVNVDVQSETVKFFKSRGYQLIPNKFYKGDE